VEVVRNGEILISDGAWGTMLQAAGLQPGECPELWNVERPEAVAAVARGYVEAGSDMIQTNSFGGSRFKLDMFGLADRTVELNEAAARISREAAGDDVWVIASVGPTGKMLLMGDVTEQDLYDAFAEQAAALVRGGADALCIETMSAIDEAGVAVRAAKETAGCEVICTFTFERTISGDYRTMMGVTPEQATAAALEAGADIVGTNCGNGIAGMVEIVRRIRTVAPAEVPVLVHANAGMPQRTGDRTVFPETPEETASYVPALLDAGCSIVGGCCGTTPEHIRAIRRAVEKWRP